MKILIADDDYASLTMLSSLVAQTGHEIVIANDGIEALAAMDLPDPPQIAILDWLMPGVDGETLCRKIRESQGRLPARAPAYIIMLTIKGEKEDIARGLDAGANDYLTKPFDPGELYSRIRAGMRTIDLEQSLSSRIMDLELREKKIQTLLAEKELLLFEVHHRIKNNMSMIVNILNLQAETLADPAAETVLRNAVGRIRSMGILYDKLYRSDDINEMSLRKYLVPLIEDIMNIFPFRHKVDLDVDIEDFPVDVPRLACLGIIVNELLFNSMKYAFVGKDGGSITIVAVKADGFARILYEDDGCGIPHPVNIDNPQTFGLKLVSGLSAQLNGTIRLSTKNGTRFTLEFPV